MLILDRAVIAIVGLAFLGLGVIGKDFRWGLRSTGPPAPVWVGRLWFIGLGVALILAAFLVHPR
jgi:ABC-type dipeptide/oligopeptide/nickel transport system permease subunit